MGYGELEGVERGSITILAYIVTGLKGSSLVKGAQGRTNGWMTCNFTSFLWYLHPLGPFYNINIFHYSGYS